MTRIFSKAILASLSVWVLGACERPADNPLLSSEAAASSQNEDLPTLGLMTSLPLYWSLDADFGELATGDAPVPWQRVILEKAHKLAPMDTLSPIPGLKGSDDPVDPLGGLEHLAIVQPRGLSPSDNVALDKWVRAGGRLLLVLDPALTGDYALPFGDPRRPVGAALIPPVLDRWGLKMLFDETQPLEPVEAALGEHRILLELFGTLSVAEEVDSRCELLAGDVVAQCTIDEGQVTVVADAALFEFPIEAREGEKALAEGKDPLSQLVQFAFE